MSELNHRTIAVQLFNRCWEIIDQATQDQERLQELLVAAMASKYHWQQVGTERNWIISDWMVSRAFAYNHNGDLALRFAQQANDAAWASEQPDWLRASAAEGVLRAYCVLGDREAIAVWSLRTRELVAVIADHREKETIAAQFEETLQIIK